MPKSFAPFCLAFIVVVSSWVVVGCSSGGGQELPPQAPKEKILAGAVERAKPMLVLLEKAKPEERQGMANMPRMSSTLQAASADPETKKKLDELGVHF